jgi:hypothetical protein
MKINFNNDIMIVNFAGDKKSMNEILDPISNEYEGPLINRQGHNFPAEYINKEHILYPYKSKCKYVIGVTGTTNLRHEMLHAKFYIDKKYRESIINEWNELSDDRRKKITDFLKKLGYSDKVIIDEYQAYRYSEKPNFFGFKIE